MSINGVGKISNFPAGTDATNLAFDALLEQMVGDEAYIGMGTLSIADIASLTDAFAWDTALGANFNILGELAEKPGKIDSKLSNLKTRNYKVPGKRTTTLEISIVGISQLQKKYLESTAFSATTMTIVLRNREKDRAIVYNGMKWTFDWSAETDGLFTGTLSTEFAGTTAGKIYVFKSIATSGIFLQENLIPFGTKYGETAAVQSYQLAGYGLRGEITITASTGWQVSTAAGSGFAGSITVAKGFNGTIYAKMTATTNGEHSATITHASTGHTNAVATIAGAVGDGTESNPYPVTTAAQLNDVRNSLSAFYKQYCDVDMSAYREAGWVPIGHFVNYVDAITPFYGQYDGNGFSITNLAIKTYSDYNGYGLFGCVGKLNGGLEGRSAVIKDVHIVDGECIARGECALLVGMAWCYSQISNCTVSGYVESTGLHTVAGIPISTSGGLIGMMYYADNYAINCHADCTVTFSGTVSDKVNSVISLGALVGDSDGKVWRCSARGNISGVARNAGGLIGYAQANWVYDCYSLATVEADTSEMTDGASGGLIGRLNHIGTAIKCWSAGKVSGGAEGFNGGFIGRPDEDEAATIIGCFWDTQASLCDESLGGAETGLNSENMVKKSTYETAEYDFTDIWEEVTNDYPELNREYLSLDDPEPGE